MKKHYLLILISIISLSVFAQKPGYYNGTEGKKGDELKAALHQIVSNHIDFSYKDAKYILEYAQEDPNNSSNLIQFYTGLSISKNSWGTGSNEHNREHVWAKSHGNFSDIRPMDGDAHNLHAADASVNITRSNYDFANIDAGTYVAEADAYYGGGAFEPSDREKGEVARTLMYMAVRYEGTNGEMDLELEDKIGTYPSATHGKLSDLLQWNKDFPPSELERRRNDRVEQSQGNRNPFIDNPEWADLIWGSEDPSTVTFSNLSMSPLHPKKTDAVSISAEIANATGLTSTLYYGKALNADTYESTMTGGSDLSASLNLSSFDDNDQVFYKIKTGANDSICGSFYLDSDDQLVAIKDIQGTGASTPLTNQQVVVSGIVTSNFDNVFTIQAGSGARSGVTVYSNFRGHIGDSVKVKGKAVEYGGLTEISNVTFLYNYGLGATVEPAEISIAEIGEDYEGVLVELKGVNFKESGSFPPSSEFPYPTFTVTDGVNDITFYTRYGSRLNDMPIPNGTHNIKAIVSEYNGVYQIMSNDTSWFTPADDTKAPAIVSVELEYVSETKVWMYVNFDEIITEESAKEESNFSVSGGFNIARNYYNDTKPNQAKIWVRNMTKGEHTLTVSNIEDMSGNKMEQTSFKFTSDVAASITSATIANVKVYPNPVVNNTFSISSELPIASYSLLTVDGKQIITVSGENRKLIVVETSSFNKGVYILNLELNDGSVVKQQICL